MPRPLRDLVPVVALALAVAGCSGSGGSEPQPADPAASASASAPASAPASGGASAPGAGQPTPADPGAPVGSAPMGAPFTTRTSALGDTSLTLTLYPLQREGAVSHLNFTLSSPAKDQEGQLGSTFGDGDGKAGDATYDTVDGIQLVDGTNAKLYLAASDGNGSCLCSQGLSNVFLRDDQPVLFSATYAAPPADVTAVDVVLPRFGTVKGVPVQ